MQLLAIHTGKIQTYQHNGSDWVTAYKKRPVTETVFAGKLNLEGDEQYHKKFHGGEHRAILMYSAGHYDMWKQELDRDLSFGSFAENFTVSGLDEDTVCIGDIYQIGNTVQVQVSQPRQPCNQIYKALDIRGIVKKVQASYRSGWYCRVLKTGEVKADTPIKLIKRLYPEWTIIRAHDARNNMKTNPQVAHELARLPELEPGWRKKLAHAQVKFIQSAR